MAVKLRLKRMGGRQKPFYRIVAADSRSPRDGRFIELVGTYDPLKGKEVVSLDEEKIMKWLGNGAEVTDTVRNIFSKNGIMKKYADSKQKPAKKVKSTTTEAKSEKKETVAKKTTTKAKKA